MSSPTILPITNQQATTTTTTQPHPFRTFLSRFSTSLRDSLSQRRPWYELIDRTSFAKPDSLTDSFTRIRKNLTYFKVNYSAIVSLVLAFSLLSHPWSLLVLLSLLGGWMFLYLFRSSELVLFGRRFSDREVLLCLVLSSVVVVFMTSVGSLLMSAFMIGVGIVCVHGAFRVPDDLFLDEQEASARGDVGLLSFIGNSAATSAAASVVTGRV